MDEIEIASSDEVARLIGTKQRRRRRVGEYEPAAAVDDDRVGA